MSENSQSSVIDRLVEEFMDRQIKGEQPTIDEYVQRYPQLADEIQDVFEALLMVEDLKPGSNDDSGTYGDSVRAGGESLDQVGDYRVLREIGRGGMGIVYEAEQMSLGRRVALKVLPRQLAGDGKSLARFQREARAAARMHHTNIVPVFDVGNDQEHVFYAMQLIQGQGLDLVIDELSELRRSNLSSGQKDKDLPSAPIRYAADSIAHSLVSGRFRRDQLVAVSEKTDTPRDDARQTDEIAETTALPFDASHSASLPGVSDISTADSNRHTYFLSVAEIGQQSASALSYAHARGIVHRDIKPSNLLLDATGIVWVTDFGLAKTGEQDLTHTGDILGTIRYMSPERFRGECDARADIYSLGLTLYELLTLRPAFAGKDHMRLVENISRSDPIRPRTIDAKVPRDLETIVLKAIDKDPRRRYQTADEMGEDLQRFLSDEPIRARRISPIERISRWSRRNKGLAASLAAVAALVVLVAVGSTVAAGRLQSLNSSLQATLVDVQTQKRRADDAATANKSLADAKQREAANALEASRRADEAATRAREARDQMAELQELTRRNLYAAEISIAQLAGVAGNAERRNELLRHWRYADRGNDPRGWEWYYLLSESLDDYAEIRSHTSGVSEIAWSPDGKRVASAGDDGEIHIHNAKSGNFVRKISAHRGTVSGLEWSPDSRQLASSGVDQVIRIWDAATGKELSATEGLHHDDIVQVRWDPQGKRLASASSDGTAMIWDAESGQQLQSFASVSGTRVTDIDWHHDGDRIAIAEMDPIVRVWSVATGQLVESFHGHADSVHSVDWHPDGKRLASSGGHREFLVWQLGQPAPLYRFEGKTGWYSSESRVGWSPDGKTLVAMDNWDTIGIHDADTGENLKMLRGHPGHQTGLSWSPDSRSFATSGDDGSVRLWEMNRDTGDASAYRSDGASVCAADWSPDGRWLATADDFGVLQMWDPKLSQIHKSFAPQERLLVHTDALRFSPDGGSIAVGRRLMNEVTVLDSETADVVIRLVGSEPLSKTDQFSGIRSLAWDDNGDRLAAGNSDGVLLTWDIASGERIELPPTNDRISSIAFLPNRGGRYLVAGYGSGNIRLWDLQERSILQQISGQPVAGLGVNQAGTRLAASSRNRDYGNAKLRIWDVLDEGTNPQLHGEYVLDRSHSVIGLDFTPDGKRLFAGGEDGRVEVWDMTGELSDDLQRRLAYLEGKKGPVSLVRVAPNGLDVMAVDEKGSVRVWSPEKGYRYLLSDRLLPSLQRRILSGTATERDYLLQARIHARQANWSAAAIVFDKLLAMERAPDWYMTDAWILDQPFPTDLELDSLPQQLSKVVDLDSLSALLHQNEDGSNSTSWWRPQTLRKNTAIDFSSIIGSHRDAAAYAMVRVYVPKSREFHLIFGSDDRHKLWVNGRLVHEKQTGSPAKRDDHAIAAHFKKGWNTILAKVSNNRDSHRLYLSLSDNPLQLAPIYETLGNSDAAEQMWNRAVNEAPKSAARLIQRAVFLSRLGRHEEANRDFENAIEGRQSEANLWRNRARAFFQLRQNQEGLADLSQALNLSPESASLLIERGNWNVRLRNFSAGATDLRKGLDLNPMNHTATYYFASLLLKLDRREQYEQLRAEMLNRWGSTKNSTIAERTAKVCLLVPTGEPLLGQIETLLGAASNHIDPAYEFYPHFVAAQGMLQYRQGEARLADQEPEQAREHFLRARSLLDQARTRNLGHFVGTHADLYDAMIRQQLGDHDQAAQLFLRVASRFKTSQFTQPGKQYGSLWHDQFMIKITAGEASRMILGPSHEKLREADRLLALGEVEPAVALLEDSIAAWDPAGGAAVDAVPLTLTRGLSLLDRYLVGYHALVPTSEFKASQWEYRFSPPPQGWNAVDDDHRGWNRGAAPFASYQLGETPTKWPVTNSEIWIRTSFEATGADSQQCFISALVDERAEFFLNGQQVATGGWIEGRYERIAMPASQLIRPGRNLLAIHCSNRYGGAAIDAGLYVKQPHEFRSRLFAAAVKAMSGKPKLMRQRALLNVRLGRWRDAAADMSGHVRSKPSSGSVEWMNAATLLAAAVQQEGGSIEEYRGFCREMVAKYGEATEISLVEQTLKSSLLLPGGNDLGPDLVDRVRNAIKQVSDARKVTWMAIASALAAYRDGDFPLSEQLAEEAEKSSVSTWPSVKENAVRLAKVIQCLSAATADQREKAQTILDQVLANQNAIAFNPDGSLIGTAVVDANGELQPDVLITHLLITEAKDLIDSPRDRKQPATD